MRPTSICLKSVCRKDIESWRWVLEDLAKRLEGAITALRYEQNALRVVLQRVEEELRRRSREGSRPGAMTPQSDSVEEAIMQEHGFLRDQKKKFEKIIKELDEQTNVLEKVQKKIENDVLMKQQTIEVEESCASIDLETRTATVKGEKNKKKTYSPLTRWENRCLALKRKGLSALTDAMLIRQQVRGARSQLSLAAQAHATQVDTALRRRQHVNKSKLQELKWQREEAVRDYNSLAEELMTSEKNTVETMEKIRLMEARLADRKQRPAKEFTKDDVDRKLRDELNRLKQYLKYLRNNIERITSLQSELTASVAKINCVEEDISQVARLDEDRIQGRDIESDPVQASFVSKTDSDSIKSNSKSRAPSNIPLSTIREDEEDEIDDYPFDF
ncbi:tektin-2-like isoform X2 [Choristoneura fumiferana]|uniref:tektin-2-like isoform X2 n=1 Tax=Choristoneura fumiferana TaxID=7141 RepID=UPI003D157C07